MSAHTPAPWRVKLHGNIPGVVVGGIVREYANGVGQDQLFMVCAVQPDNGGDQAQAANAHLIAAAPYLFAALQTMLDEYVALVNCGDCGNWDPEEEAMVIAARAALKKATGD